MYSLLQLGTTGNSVITLQTQLQSVLGLGSNFVIDGEFGPQTEAAVKAFQQQYQLQVDGMAGSMTAAELNRAFAAIQQNVASASAVTTAESSAVDANVIAVLLQQLEQELESRVAAADGRMKQAEARAMEVTNALNQALTILRGVLKS